MKVMIEPGAMTPTRAHGTEGGLDLYAMDGAVIPPNGSRVFHTGVHVELPPGTCGLLVSKSGLNTKHGITSTGLIDKGFTGEIRVMLHNHKDIEYEVLKHDKITQLVVLPVLYVSVEIVDELNADTERGDSGYGSTGR